MVVSGSSGSTARSRLGRLYWRVAENLPDRWRPTFARFATAVAHGRRAVRRVRRRAWRRSYRWLRPRLRERAGDRLLQWLSQRFPAVRLAGTGPVWLVDARGVPATEVATAVDHRRRQPRATRLVVMVDDPRVDALRAAGIVYEYVPAALDQASLEARVELLTWGYGVERTVLFTEL